MYKGATIRSPAPPRREVRGPSAAGSSRRWWKHSEAGAHYSKLPYLRLLRDNPSFRLSNRGFKIGFGGHLTVD